MCNSTRLCANEECQTCFEKSLASHEKSEFWSEKNGDVKPRQVFKKTTKKYWFDCNICCHEFEKRIDHVTSNTWCPYCSNPPKKLCDKDDCHLCFNKSVASHEKSKYWSDKNGDIKPRYVFKSSNTKYYFNCRCGHDIFIMLHDIVAGYWCPYCSNPPQKLCDNQDCKTCFNKSFASHEKSKYWSDKNGDVKPRQVFKQGNNSCYFICDCGHEFDSRLNSITYQNTWCPYCSNPSKKLCDNKDCKKCYEKSFASHEKSQYFSEKKCRSAW